MIFAPEQQAVKNEVKVGNGNIAVQATAGAGKTTTLLACLNEIPRFKKSIFLSFSKFIVEELKERVPKHIKACTLHSFGFGLITARYKGIKLDEDKYLKLCLKTFDYTSNPKKQKENFRKAICMKDIINYARMTLTPLDRKALIEMCGYYSLDFTPDVIDSAIPILKNIGKVSFTTVDFTDMIYIPAIKPDLFHTTYDYVMVDECQDNNACQTKFIELLGGDSSRYIFVGDKNQAIYGFMGSRVDSFDIISKKFNCKLFTLSCSYRCPKNVVLFAQGIYNSITFHENSIEGDVRMGGVSEIREGDMVLCRNTLPLIFVFFELIERNIKATIIGKDIEGGLVEFAKSVSGYSFKEIEGNMDMQLIALREELLELGYKKPENHKKYGALTEKIQVINLILNKIDRPDQLVQKIHDIFHEDKKAARLMTIHKSKGGECNRVFIIESFKGKVLVPSEYAQQPHEIVQETNLSFVASTRSKGEMILIDM